MESTTLLYLEGPVTFIYSHLVNKILENFKVEGKEGLASKMLDQRNFYVASTVSSHPSVFMDRTILPVPIMKL
jgi:hypothetical protein